MAQARIDAAARLGTQLIVVTHYPTVGYLERVNSGGLDAMELLKSARVPMVYIGAHVHSTDNTSHTSPQLRREGFAEFCVGGGGGWSCDGHQGFVSGEVRASGRVANLRLHLAPDSACCIQNPRYG